MDRRLFIHLQGGRNVSGILRGFDMFLNLVLDQAYEEVGGGQRKPAGMVVSRLASGGERVWCGVGVGCGMARSCDICLEAARVGPGARGDGDGGDEVSLASGLAWARLPRADERLRYMTLHLARLGAAVTQFQAVYQCQQLAIGASASNSLDIIPSLPPSSFSIPCLLSPYL